MLKVFDQTTKETKTLYSDVISDRMVSRVLLMVALAAGAFVRIWKLNAMGYNTDEAIYSGQAAAIAGIAGLKDIFPVFRAHPLFVQFLLSLVYRQEFNDLAGRLLAVVAGLGTVFVTYLIAKNLYGYLAGSLAALFIAVMPYHVLVSRQMLLDGPMVFFATLTMYTLVRFAKSKRSEWLIASGSAMGLTFLSKETSIVLIGAIFAFLALSPDVRVRIKDLLFTVLAFGLVVAPFPAALFLSAGGSSTGLNYLTWQLFRRPNHEWTFYIATLPEYLGVLLLFSAIFGMVVFWKPRSWKKNLLLSWIVVYFGFFQIWPVKGFQYLLPLAPVVAVLAARTFGKLLDSSNLITLPDSLRWLCSRKWISWVVIGLTVVTMSITSWQRIQPEISSTFLAGTGGVAGGREAGTWIKANIPEFARIMTIGPSMANILQFYGERHAYGLSVSPNPLHRNPSYTPILNPDLQIRRTDINYIVWDSYSASRSPFFSDKIMSYVKKYNGTAVHTETISVPDGQGNQVQKPVIVIYEVHP